MEPWSQDFSGCGLDEILRLQTENRMWSKELRRKSNALVNGRLAKNMSQDDYMAGRKRVHEDTAECRNRANLLDAQLVRHSGLLASTRQS